MSYAVNRNVQCSAGVSFLMGRRYGNLSCFFVGALELYSQERLLNSIHDPRAKFALGCEQPINIVRARICGIIEPDPQHHADISTKVLAEVLMSAVKVLRELNTAVKRVVNRWPPASADDQLQRAPLIPHANLGSAGVLEVWVFRLGRRRWNRLLNVPSGIRQHSLHLVSELKRKTSPAAAA